jgi:CheY-like chemotaxis protein
MTILVVDDSKTIHSLVKELLNEFGKIKLCHAYDGQEAIDFIELSTSQNLKLVLMDWEMPIMSGIDALPELKKRKPDLPILMMTSKN